MYPVFAWQAICVFLLPLISIHLWQTCLRCFAICVTSSGVRLGFQAWVVKEVVADQSHVSLL